MGARYIPCMKPGTGFDTPGGIFPCPSGIIGSAKNETYCNLSDICDFGGLVNVDGPNQWYRFIIPIFLHGGVLHLLFNLSLQIQAGFDLEKVAFN
jgi:membrane associated rhomboid family serine protease